MNTTAAASSANGGTATKLPTPARKTVRIREVVSAMLVTPDGGLLLQLRDDKPGLLWANHWTLFGGSVEPGETPVTAVARELAEELELALPLTLWHRFPCPYRSQPGQLVCMHYAYWGRLNVPLESLVLHEGQRFGVFTPGEAATMQLAFNQQEVVRDFIAMGVVNG